MRPLIMVDSNAIKPSMDFSSGSWRRLLSLSKGNFVELSIPSVVLLEVARQWEEELEKARRDYEAKRAAFQRKLSVIRPSESVKIEALPNLKQADYYQHALGLLRNADASVPEVPPIEIEDLLRDDLAVRKPFKRDGTGMRDALIWATVRAQAEIRAGGENLFVTANLKDFCADDGQSVHPHLTRGLAAAVQIEVVPGLNELFERPSIAKLVKEIEVIEVAITEHLVFDRLESAIEALDLQDLGPMLEEDIGDGFTVNLIPSPLEEPEIDYLETIPSTVRWDVFRSQDQSNLVVEASIDVECEVTGFLTNFEASTIDAGSSVRISDPFWNDHMVAAVDTALLRLQFVAVVAPEALTDIQFELDGIRGLF